MVAANGFLLLMLFENGEVLKGDFEKRRRKGRTEENSRNYIESNRMYSFVQTWI